MKEISIEFDRNTSMERVSELSHYCAAIAQLITSRKQGRIPQFHAADGDIIWPLLHAVVKKAALEHNCRFCELGSGTGLATMMAATMGMHARGIEIESELVTIATRTAAHFELPCKFVLADMFQMSANYYSDVDLFFAYPWPAQASEVIAFFSQRAKPASVLCCYHGGLQFQVLQQADH